VLIHGTTRSGGDWWELGYVGRLLELGRRVLVVDPLGHGQSDAPGDPSDYRYPDVAFDIAAVMTAVGIERAAIWGYSRGAALGASLAIEAPERVERLVIGGQGGLEQPPPTTLEAFHRGMLAGDWGAFWATPMAVAWNTDADHPYAEANFDIRAFGAAWAGLRLFPYAFRLDAIRCPVLLYQGGDDDPDDAVKTASLLGVEARIIPGRDHNSAMWDIDAVWPAVEPFLSLPPASS
jgi:pimeloyl-ACP methyl ester carboxylesterase